MSLAVRPILTHVKYLIFGWTISSAAIASPMSHERLTQDTETKVKASLVPILEKYCSEACQIIGVEVEVDEEIPDGNDMGFENLSPANQDGRLFVSKVGVEVQIDDRVTSVNRDRLEAILQNHLRAITAISSVKWRVVQIPRIGRSGEAEQQMREKLESKINQTLGRVIEQYCPEQCIIEKVEIQSTMISPDEAMTLKSTQKITDDSGRSVMRVEGVEIDVSMDEEIPIGSRSSITGIMRTRTKFVEPVTFNLSVSPFPESYAHVSQRQRQDETDPYGLEKLRQMLIMFRELAGTKEIITNSRSESNNATKNDSTTSQISRDSSTIASKEKESNKTDSIEVSKQNATTSSGSITSLSTEELLVYGAISVLFLALVWMAVIKFIGANRAANEMVIRTDRHSSADQYSEHKEPAAAHHEAAHGGPVTTAIQKNDMSLRLRIQEIKQELTNIFMENPKVAKETFGRMIKEDGIEETSKFVKILGHVVVFELLNDPSMQRDLYLLSEYFHNSQFDFSSEEEFSLLNKLKTRCTAAEIRVFANQNADRFDFLNKLDPGQVYKLVSGEKTQLQSIVLSQLDRKKRMAVFEMYTGQLKIALMSELSMAEAIPKEYLFNVARALQRKVQDSPEFDVENLRSSDILLDLLEKAELNEQRQLMANLAVTNAGTARAIKQKLVTVEILGYVRDGHLLEIILGLQREDLLAFMAGGRDHIRDLLLRKAPQELADTWLEDLGVMAHIDDQTYRLAEMKVTGRIRALANSGVINLLEINDMIYNQSLNNDDQQRSQTQPFSSASMVA